jgi:hypothetical protein
MILIQTLHFSIEKTLLAGACFSCSDETNIALANDATRALFELESK